MLSRIIAPSRLRLRTTCNIQYERVNGQQVHPQIDVKSGLSCFRVILVLFRFPLSVSERGLGGEVVSKQHHPRPLSETERAASG